VGVYAHVAVVAVVDDVVVAAAAAAATAATVVDVVSVAAGPAVAAGSAQGDSRERWKQAVVVLALAERLALCYTELWTVVAAPLPSRP